MGAVNEFAVQADAFVEAPQHINAVVLAANVAQDITIPDDGELVAFTRTANFFARYDGGVAAVPAAAVTNGAAAECNPKQRAIKGVQRISVVSDAACIVTAAFYFGR